MSSTNNPAIFSEIDPITADWLIPYALSSSAIAVGIGDLCYNAGSDVAYPADQFVGGGVSEFADQLNFAQQFVGISQQQVLSTETNSKKRFTVRQMAVVDITCVSNTFNKGDLVAVYSTGAAGAGALTGSKVDKTSDPDAAIGVVLKYYSSAVTTVRCLIFARGYWDLAMRAFRLVYCTTVAATGSTQGGAAALTTGFILVTGGNNSTGVILPPSPNVGSQNVRISVKNSGTTLNVYPPVGQTINALASNTAITMAPNAACDFVSYNATSWYTIPLLPS